MVTVKSRWVCTATLFVITFLLSSCTSRSFLESQQKAFASIDRFNMLYLQAINEGNLELLSSLTTDDHMVVTNGDELLVGKDALLETMRDAFERFDFSETWIPEETLINGDLAYQRGNFTVLATPRHGMEVNR